MILKDLPRPLKRLEVEGSPAEIIPNHDKSGTGFDRRRSVDAKERTDGWANVGMSRNPAVLIEDS